jgi:hypothetical protein
MSRSNCNIFWEPLLNQTQQAQFLLLLDPTQGCCGLKEVKSSKGIDRHPFKEIYFLYQESLEYYCGFCGFGKQVSWLILQTITLIFELLCIHEMYCSSNHEIFHVNYYVLIFLKINVL